MSLHDGQPFPHFQQVKLVETMCLLLHVVTVNQRMKSATGTQEPLTHTEIHHSQEEIEWKRDGRLEQKPGDSQ